MPIYAVQRQLPGITPGQLAMAQKAAMETSENLTRKGIPVKYIRSNFYPSNAHCTCLFESPDVESVRRANEEASLPFEKIEEVFDLTP